MMLLSRPHQHSVSHTLLYIVVLYLSLFGLLGYSVMTQRVSVTGKDQSGDIDPVAMLLCLEINLPSGYTDLTFQWEHDGRVLSRNDTLVDGDISRHSVDNDGRELYIRNAVRDDGGRYTCRVLYRLGSDSQEIMNVSNSFLMSITQYLPPINYPECSISSDTVVTVGSEITLICDPGDSNSPLTLRIQTSTSVTFIISSTGMLKRTVSEIDIMAQFTCIMTSDIFPSARRMCSATILNATTVPPPTPTIRISPTTESHITSSNEITPIQGTIQQGYITSGGMINSSTATSGSGSGSGNQSPAVMAGVVIGGLLVLLVIVGIIVAVIIFIRRKSEEKPPSSPPGNGTRETGDMRVDFSKADDIYSEETIDNIDSKSPDIPSTSTGHPPNQPRPVSVVYSVVDKTKSNGTSGAVQSTNPTPKPTNPKNNGDAVYECADLDKRPPINPTAADAAVGAELPVYGKVNKGYKTDKKDDGQSKRESSGFVENTIYEPSQI